MAGVLLYHRVNVTSSDPWSLNVSPRHFVEHLEVLRAQYRVVPLNDLVRNLGRGLLSDAQVAVTFDDGYADNLYEALPALERLDLPATFFVTSGCSSAGREFWWDELDHVLLQPGTLPGWLTLEIQDERIEWDLGDARLYTAGDSLEHARWLAWEPPPTSRHALYLTLWSRCRSLHPSTRDGVLRELHDWAALAPVTRSTHRLMEPEEITAVGASACAEIGAHTVSHPSLAVLPLLEQRFEIERSKLDLEDGLGRPVSAFAYPFGKKSDYSQATLDLVRASGFACACINEPGNVTALTPPFELPRLSVRDINGVEFQRWLSGNLG
jgi:peptidoglycan/xylan/chitin deacetylase (PgdA/CDA1 family)